MHASKSYSFGFRRFFHTLNLYHYYIMRERQYIIFIFNNINRMNKVPDVNVYLSKINAKRVEYTCKYIYKNIIDMYERKL